MTQTKTIADAGSIHTSTIIETKCQYLYLIGLKTKNQRTKA